MVACLRLVFKKWTVFGGLGEGKGKGVAAAQPISYLRMRHVHGLLWASRILNSTPYFAEIYCGENNIALVFVFSHFLLILKS